MRGIDSVGDRLRSLQDRGVTAASVDDVLAATRRMLLLRAVVEASVPPRELTFEQKRVAFKRWSKQFDAAWITELAVGHENEALRRGLQEFFIYGAFEVDALWLRDRVSLRGLLARVLVAGVLSTGSVVVAHLLFGPAIEALGVQYPVLILAQVVVAVLVLYLQPLMGARRGLAVGTLNAVWPLGKDGQPIRLLATWPLPAVVIVGLAVGLAWVFDRFGWAQSAGFALGALYATIGVGLGWLVLLDD